MSVPQVHVKMVEHVMIKSTHSGAHVMEAGVEVLVKQVSWQGRAVQQSMAYPSIYLPSVFNQKFQNDLYKAFFPLAYS